MSLCDCDSRKIVSAPFFGTERKRWMVWRVWGLPLSSISIQTWPNLKHWIFFRFKCTFVLNLKNNNLVPILKIIYMVLQFNFFLKLWSHLILFSKFLWCDIFIYEVAIFIKNIFTYINIQCDLINVDASKWNMLH